MPRRRTVPELPPTELGSLDGLAYSLWLPADGRAPNGGIVIIHGAHSCKENHHDYARAALAVGLAAIAFDQRGHGASAGPLDGRAITDVAAVAAKLRASIGRDDAPVALRGSSLGGYLALVAAAPAAAAAVVAICPAGAGDLRHGLHSGRLGFDADVAALDRLLESNDPETAIESLTIPILLLHAEGDEQIPIRRSRELAARLRSPGSRLIATPGGDHRSIQHDGDLQAASLQFIERAFDPSR